MKIVVLDGHTLNPGDLSWDGLQALGLCEVFDRTAPAEVLLRARQAAAVLTNKTVLTREHIANLPELAYVGVLATGYNNVDVAAARERGIPVTNVPAYGTASVAQMTMALLLELALGVGRHAQSVRAGQWTRCPDFCYWQQPLLELDGLTLGIVGYGRIGEAVARWALALGMRVLVHEVRPLPELPQGLQPVDLDRLFSASDVVSLHCPLTEQTRHLVNAARLARMKPSAFLINTSRGPLVDESALAEALDGGRLAGAALDVLSVEPPPGDHPLLQARNCLITPHLAWATRAARARLMRIAVANLEAFRAGHPQNVVNA
ncbi:MAG: D-2-hydroxyacid dehydrogenase [Verrucomicrobia bacterium]|nr:D-2-hydroxyacid dehydrogenase [Verrucomicrobiota bacterium]